MPIFRYKGYKADGSEASGTMEAEGLKDAALSVRALGVYPKEISEFVPKSRRFSFRGSEAALLPHVTRQLATLLSSGVPLLEALRTLSEEAKGGWSTVLSDVKERVSGGESLPRALEVHAKLFPSFYCSLVSAGIESGTLDKVLSRLADFLEEEASIKAKVRAAMTYPIFMVSVSFVVMAFLFVFVIPKIVRVFENAKAALPISTVILITVSNLFVHYWWAIGGLALIGAFLQKSLREKYRPSIDRLKLQAPVIESLYMTRFARTLGFLLEGGVPVLKALDLSAKAMGNVFLSGRVSEAAKKVAEGARLSQSLTGFPPVLLQLLATGERTGRLPEILSRAADSYEEEFTRRVNRALSLIEPSMIIVMGLAVGFIVMAVLLPMFQLNQLIK